MTDYFKSIRPFNDDEVPKALLQIKDTPLIRAMMAYAFLKILLHNERKDSSLAKKYPIFRWI